MLEQNMGTVISIVGPVLDIKFPPQSLPNLLNAVEIEYHGRKVTV